MKKVVLLDTSIASNNMGDEIIMRSAETQMKPLLRDFYILRYPTHTQAFSWYQSHNWEKADIVRAAEFKFIFGTDLLCKDMLHSINLWNINLLNCGPLKNTILVGVGCSLEKLKKINLYTRVLYNKVLSHDYIHSTRDEETAEMLDSMGFKAIVTGCPTLWGLTSEFCKQIPTTKSKEVVFTLSGTAQDKTADKALIDILKKNYEKVYFWVQTVFDEDYLKELTSFDDIKVIRGGVTDYGLFLDRHNIDYVGIRLHGGIYAMQHKKRAIIISIDHRARNINSINHLNCIERENITELESMINSDITTDITVNYENLNTWMNQFK